MSYSWLSEDLNGSCNMTENVVSRGTVAALNVASLGIFPLASFALSDAGFETIMVNCNPETVSTD